MDASYREFARREATEFVPIEEIIRRRLRVGACIICATQGAKECPCIGVYVYQDKNKKFHLRRNKRSTLPYGIITNVLCNEAAVVILKLHGGVSSPGYLRVSDILDIEIAIRDGIDINEKERRALTRYISALEEASDLGTEEQNDKRD